MVQQLYSMHRTHFTYQMDLTGSEFLTKGTKFGLSIAMHMTSALGDMKIMTLEPGLMSYQIAGNFLSSSCSP